MWPQPLSFVTPSACTGVAGLSIARAISSSVTIVWNWLRHIGQEDSGEWRSPTVRPLIDVAREGQDAPASLSEIRSCSDSLGKDEMNVSTALAVEVSHDDRDI